VCSLTIFLFKSFKSGTPFYFFFKWIFVLEMIRPYGDGFKKLVLYAQKD